jgi:mevalonate kinase
VLAGEHAVLRGATAIALPHPEFKLKLTYTPDRTGGLRVEPDTARVTVEELLQSIAESRQGEGYSFRNPEGTLKIESTIPMGAGLGSSAALCVAMARWLQEPLSLSRGEIPEFATRLEHRFHGRSSGMDVAVIAEAEPVSFIRGQRARSLGIKRLPRFTFHDTGLRARTSECVYQVERYREERPVESMKVDERMSEASRLGMEGLIAYDRSSSDSERARSVELLTRAMKLGQDCYDSWRLIPEEGRRIEQELYGKGARAVKLTGAGGGGMLVALWPENLL